MPRAKTNEEYYEEVSRINPNIEVFGFYVNGLTKMINTTKGTIEALDWKLNLSNLIISLTVYRCEEEIIEEVKKMSSAREFEEKYPELYLMHYKK